jgi:hypothetical protein
LSIDCDSRSVIGETGRQNTHARQGESLLPYLSHGSPQNILDFSRIHIYDPDLSSPAQMEKLRVQLDESIDHLRKQVEYLKKFSEKTVEHFDTMDKKMQSVVSGMHTVRFNPFKGTGHGSNQSFATAFVNDKGDGVVISSLYSREHVSIFSKPISKMSSEYELTAEEREALQKAKESIE